MFCAYKTKRENDELALSCKHDPFLLVMYLEKTVFGKNYYITELL